MFLIHGLCKHLTSCSRELGCQADIGLLCLLRCRTKQFSHTGEGGSTMAQRIAATGWDQFPQAENIVSVQGFQDSPAT